MLEKKHPKDEMGDLSYQDYLIQRGKARKEKYQKIAQEKEENSTTGCTFKPKILNKKFNKKEGA
jgi:hypothetical protein